MELHRRSGRASVYASAHLHQQIFMSCQKVVRASFFANNSVHLPGNATGNGNHCITGVYIGTTMKIHFFIPCLSGVHLSI